MFAPGWQQHKAKRPAALPLTTQRACRHSGPVSNQSANETELRANSLEREARGEKRDARRTRHSRSLPLLAATLPTVPTHLSPPAPLTSSGPRRGNLVTVFGCLQIGKLTFVSFCWINHPNSTKKTRHKQKRPGLPRGSTRAEGWRPLQGLRRNRATWSDRRTLAARAAIGKIQPSLASTRRAMPTIR